MTTDLKPDVFGMLAPFVQHRGDCALSGHWMEAAEKACNCGLAVAIEKAVAQSATLNTPAPTTEMVEPLWLEALCSIIERPAPDGDNRVELAADVAERLARQVRALLALNALTTGNKTSELGADPALVASPSSPQAVSTKGFDPGEEAGHER